MWYFSTKEGEVKRRTVEKLNSEKIKEFFLARKTKSKIIAYFVHLKEN